ncbi:MAG: pyridine nucleotide-disulfide oxidoreductase/dicluster-binding protein [Peptococcaceae bacterium]
MFALTQQSLHQWEALCTQDQPPYCTARCPLHVDGKGLCAAVEKGNFTKGREILEKYMVLPRILSAVCEGPCRSKCRRQESGEAIELQRLEQACMTYGKKKQGGGRLAFIRKKTERVAVVGAGMAGLSAAMELGMRGYGVTLLEKENQPGGRLLQIPAEVLSPEALEQDLKKMNQLGITLQTGCAVDRAGLEDLLAQYDAVYVSEAVLSDLQADVTVDRQTLQTSTEKLFAGNTDPTRHSFIQDASDGKKVAISVERYLQQASLTLNREQEGVFDSKLFTRLDGVTPSAAVMPQAVCYTEAEAQAEAARCIQCRCTECLDGCAFLRYYKRYPKLYAREVFNNSTIVMGIHGANGMINSCSLCGQCQVLCPNGFDMSEICRVAREDMVKRGKMPPSTHDFALMDMAFSNGDEYFLVRHQPGRTESRYALFPGCQMGASMPDLIKQVYADLTSRLEGGVGLILGCCGAIADWAGDQPLLAQELEKIRAAWEQLGKPQMITLCPSCYRTFQQAGIPAIGMVDMLLEAGMVPPAGQKGVLAVHDSCAARFDGPLQDGVRALARQAGYEIEELPYSRERTHCCGYGGLTSLTNREVNQETVQQCIGQSDRDYLTYCVNCRDQFLQQGKRALHLLELFYGVQQEPVADLSQRRLNRCRLNYEMRKEVWGEEIEMPKPKIQYEIADDVRCQMHDRMILETDVVQVLEHADATREMIYNRAKDRYFSSLRIGHVTFWVEFDHKDGVYQVCNVYSHRMSFEECDTGGAVL